MFTGIVEEVGQITDFVRQVRGGRLTIRCAVVLNGTALGDSIAVSGVCLTVVEKDHHSFTADATEETLSRSILKDVRPGLSVNLERAATLSSRLGGHLVQGHVDTVGVVLSDVPQGNGRLRTFRLPASWMRYVVEKGSVTVDGVSLTVAEKRGDTFSVAIIPDSLARTTLLEQKAGGVVNIEVDVIAKYVESLLGTRTETLSADKLKEYGF